jgi:thiosulfate reductase cytochrome b subunit
MATDNQTIHRGFVRVFHWLNAIGIILMIGSGWRIYNASPLFDFSFPRAVTIGGWLGGALRWHFAAMWLLVINLLVFLIIGFAGGHFRRRYLPLTPGAVIGDFTKALRGKLPHDLRVYNAVQKSSYIGVLLAILVTIVSGIAVWKPVQAQAIAALLGGYEGARLVHFFGMTAIALFIVVHLALVLIVPSTLRPMITGKEPARHAVQTD